MWDFEPELPREEDTNLDYSGPGALGMLVAILFFIIICVSIRSLR